MNSTKQLFEEADEPLSTKCDNVFTNDVRLCAMELLSLEVAAEKVRPVIQSVGSRIFHTEITTKNLPNRSSVMNISDEGHYLMKRHIAEELMVGHWGLNKDGTTRRKEKILDTAVTTSTGKVMSLGFIKLAHEDSATVAQVCQNNIKELGDILEDTGKMTSSDFVTSALERWAYIMNDRAATEKATNDKLILWRDEMLRKADATTSDIIHQFFCSAHVLLGFHRNVVKRLDEHQKSLRAQNIRLGRDALPRFFIWRSTQAAERTVRMTSEIFGPCGDFIGLRDRWESDCEMKGRKSYITSYRDNRFNGLFEVAAQVFYHRQELLDLFEDVREMLKRKKQCLNQKLVSVKADLECPIVMTIVQALGLLYVHVTRPFWEMCNSQDIKYLQLYTYFQPLYTNLHSLRDDPLALLKADAQHAMIPDYPPKDGPILTALSTPLMPDKVDLLKEILTMGVEGLLKTMDDQLKDFLEGGKYSSAADEKELKRTAFSHLTNIACEHHFGSLDSSQKRRPNATFHHHTTIELLKKNFHSFMEGLEKLDGAEKSAILKLARKRGRELRLKHQQEDRNVAKEIQDELKIKEPAPKKVKKIAKKAVERKRKGDSVCKKKVKTRRIEPTQPKPFTPIKLSDDSCGKWVAVIYTTPTTVWYPGIICEVVSSDTVLVKFMHPTKPATNQFRWPLRDDVDVISTAHIFDHDFSVDAADSMGRSWTLTKYADILAKYQEHAVRY